MVILKIAVIVILSILCIQDIKNKQVSIAWCVALGIVGVVIGAITVWSHDRSLFELGLGIGTGAFFLLLAVIKKDQIGYGDGVILVALGFVFGRQTVYLLAIASVFAGLFGVCLLLCKKGTRETRIPFVPALMIGTCISMFL